MVKVQPTSRENLTWEYRRPGWVRWTILTLSFSACRFFVACDTSVEASTRRNLEEFQL